MNFQRRLDPATVEDADDVLVVAPRIGGADELCRELLATGPTPEHVIGVTVGESPGAALREWRSHLPGSVDYSFVTVDGAARSAAAGAATADGATVETVPDVTPLSRLGSRIVDRIDGDRRTTVCLRSVTDLTEYAGQEAVFRFLSTLGAEVRAAGATGHYHLDAAAHDPATRALFETLFDAVVEYDDDRDAPR